MDDVGRWLEELGLGRYAEVFQANDVTAEVLPELTDADLRELGLSLGHRRLLLKAIEGRAEVVTTGPEPLTDVPSTTTSPRRLRRDRRHPSPDPKRSAGS